MGLLKSCLLYTPLSGALKKPCSLKKFKEIPNDFWPGSFTVGNKIMKGIFPIDEEWLSTYDFFDTINCSKDKSIFSIYKVHSFEWLRDVKMVQSHDPRMLIRNIISTWIDNHHKNSFSLKAFSQESCCLDVTGYRIANWISLFDFYGTSSSDKFYKKAINSLNVQFNYVKQFYSKEKDPVLVSRALRGIFWFCTFLKKENDFFPLKDYLDSVYQQLLDDGGHISYSPSQLLILLRDILEISILSKKFGSKVKVPNELIEVLASRIRFFRHVNGQLADFDGISSSRERGIEPIEISPYFIDAVLFASDTKMKPPKELEISGYSSYQCNNNSVIIINRQRNNSKNPIKYLSSFEYCDGNKVLLKKSSFEIKSEINLDSRNTEKSYCCFKEDRGSNYISLRYDIDNVLIKIFKRTITFCDLITIEDEFFFQDNREKYLCQKFHFLKIFAIEKVSDFQIEIQDDSNKYDFSTNDKFCSIDIKERNTLFFLSKIENSYKKVVWSLRKS